MRVFKTPGVYRREIDLSDILVPAGVSDGGIVIRARKGPVNRPVLVTNDKEFIETFGEPYYLSGKDNTTTNGKYIPEYGYGSYAALEFLKESSTLYVVRDFDESGDKYASIAYTTVALASTPGTGITGNRATIPDSPNRISILDSGFNSTSFYIGAVYPSTDGNSLAVTIEPFSSSADWKYNYDEYPSVVSATTAQMSGCAGNIAATQMGTTDQDKYYPIASKVFKMNVYEKPSDLNWVDLYNCSADRANSKLRINPIETFYGSLLHLQDGNKNQLFIEEVVNGNSQHIYIKNGLTGNRFTPTALTTSLPVLSDTTSDYVQYSKLGQLAGGAIKANQTGINDLTGWSLFENREYVNVSILIGTSYATLYKQEVARIVAKRMDCIAVVQAGELDDTTVTTILDIEKYGYQAPSYVALYGGYSKVYDKYNDRNVYLPNSIFGASLMARCDNIADPWSAPAGIDRATMAVLDQKVVFSFDDIGKLYDRNINMPRFINGVGNVMWGQKTAQLKKSALDRINVRRNLLYIENNVERSLLSFVFENNTYKTRLRIFALVDNFLSSVKAGGGLYDYTVVCDETNNTANVIDSNQLNVDLYVQPVKTAEFIQLTTVITRTGISFSEVRIPVA